MGRSAVRLLFEEAGELGYTSSAGSSCCAGITATTGRASAADFCRPPGVDSWDALLASHRDHADEAGRRAASTRSANGRGIVAERYYTLAEQAIRAADPDALYFGDRLPIYYDPAAVRAMAPHVDAIATNYNVDSGDGWIADYFFDGLQEAYRAASPS